MEVEMRLATFTLTDPELRASLAHLDGAGRRVRLGWLRERTHRWAHRRGPRVHDWLISRRWYRWWRRQVYGPSLVQEQAQALARRIDRDIAEALLRGVR